MANPLVFVLYYTPLIWWLVVYFFLFRHELSRLLHPIRERRGLKDWVAVLSDLRLIDSASPALQEEGKEKWWRKSRTTHLLLSSLVLWLSAVLVSNFVDISQTLPGGFPYGLLKALLPSLFLFALQALPAIPLIILTYRYCGPRPVKKEEMQLSKNRKGSLIRYLDKEKP
ncbi:MAG: hypothetical protein JRN45_00470 [Nitrososphaerota archaeon]|nr:hypothetical protein [Nitrososphaerota archaeon]